MFCGAASSFGVVARSLFLVMFAAGCGAGAPPPPPPQPTALIGRPPEKPDRMPRRGEPARTSKQGELVPVLAEKPDPEAERFFLARLAQPAVTPEATKPPRVTALALENTARGQTGGMKAEGEMLTAALAEGQRAAMKVTIPKGGCAAFIAQGGLGVIDVDLFLTRYDEGVTRVIAQAPPQGPFAVIGGRGACFENAEGRAIDAELHAVLRRGGGTVVIQQFRREGGGKGDSPAPAQRSEGQAPEPRSGGQAPPSQSGGPALERKK